MRGVGPEIRSYLDEVVSTLTDHLGPELVGAYVHGSLAMDAFVPSRSDIDVLAVCAGPLTPERRIGLGEALAGIPRPASASDLEFSLVTETAARTRSSAPSFEIHVSTHEERPVIDGHDRPGDVDLVVHFAMARRRGRALTGPEPTELFAEPDRTALIWAFLSDIGWAREQGAAGWEGHARPDLESIAYRVLNAARSWRYLETGELGSKQEGAAWLRRRVTDPRVRALLDAALAFQRGDPATPPEDQEVDAFVDRVEAMLRSAAG